MRSQENSVLEFSYKYPNGQTCQDSRPRPWSPGLETKNKTITRSRDQNIGKKGLDTNTKLDLIIWSLQLCTLISRT